jgi:hypothetical protein
MIRSPQSAARLCQRRKYTSWAAKNSRCRPTAPVTAHRGQDMTEPIEPYQDGMLDVCDGNLVSWEACGNPDGKPALVVHGGPGSGAQPDTASTSIRTGTGWSYSTSEAAAAACHTRAIPPPT